MMVATKPENAVLIAGKYYIGKGLRVFPLRKHLKTPATGNGFKSASLDPDQIEQWFNNDDGLNIGIATGNGLVVVDLDCKHGIDGRASLAVLEAAHGALPDTLTAITPSGGEHRLFRYPPAIDIRSSAGKLGAGIDIRGNGGYIAAAPSHTEASADPQGRTMSGDYRFIKQLPVADLPQAWLDLLTKGREEQKPPPQQRTYQRPESNDFQRLAEIQDALNYINPQDSDDWLKVGMALYPLGDNGLNLWDTWSRNASNYDQKENHRRWKSFDGTSVGVESVFYLAQAAGWQNPAKGRRPQQDARVVQFPQYQHREEEQEPPQQQAQQEQRREWRGNQARSEPCDHVQLVSGLSIPPRSVEWVWSDWSPKGKITLLVGAPKTGKTLLAIDIAATITSGGNFPDGTRADKASVLFWSGEDDLNDTIVPRFKAAGGDLSKVLFIDHTVSGGRGQPFNPAADMPLLMDTIRRMEKPPAMLIIDPVVSVTHDMNNALQVRLSLEPLKEMAQEHGLAVLGITHFRKSSGESGNIGERIIGSSAFLQVARMVWYAVKPPDMDGQRVFFKGDTNLAESDMGFMYEVESREAEFREHQKTIVTAGVLWGEKVEGEALQSLIKPDGKPDSAPVQAEAEEFLKQYLASGARLKKDIDEESDNRGITRIALSRAKKALGIRHRKRRGDTRFEWYLSEPDQQLDQAHT